MKNPISISSLQDLGLNAYQAKAYLALLERNTLTATEVANLAGIPRPRVYEVLQTLMSRGLCVLKPGRLKTYGATDPSALKDMLLPGMQSGIETQLENLKIEQRKLVLKKKEMLTGVQNLIQDLRPIYKKGSSDYSALEFIEVIKDPHQMHKTYMQLCAEAQKEIVGFAKPPYSRSREGIEEQHAQQAQLMERGVTLRSIYEIPKDKQEIQWWFETIDAAAKHGEEARVLEELPVKMVIFDSRIVMLALEDPVSVKPSMTTQIIEHRDLAKALTILFQFLWEQAQDYNVLRG